jgi:hypothetical protein
MKRFRRTVMIFFLLAALAATTSLVGAQKVDLALVLLIDDSGSIDDGESQMQLRGYANAFRSPQVIEAMTRGPNKSIAVSAVMFTDRVQVMIPWMRLDGKQSADTFAARMQGLPRMPGAATHIAKGIEFSINHISRCPFEFFASTIDLSADGVDNEFMPAISGAAVITGVLGAITGINVGVPNIPDPISSRRLTEVRNYAKSRGITINAIAIEDPALKDYFSRYVTTGPSSFTMFAPSFRAFTDMIQRKLVREINESVKISTARQNKATEVRRARAVSSPSPTPAATARRTPARAAADAKPDAVTADPGEPADVVRESTPGEVEQDREPAPLVVEFRPPVERRIQLLTRDAINDFPIDEIRIEALDGSEILFEETPEGRPGLTVLEMRTPAGQTPRIRVSAPLYLSKDVNLPVDLNEITLDRQPLRIVW